MAAEQLKRGFLLSALLLMAGCRYTQPDLSFRDPAYLISASPKVNGRLPPKSVRFRAESYYTMWFWGIVDGHRFQLEPFLKERMGSNRVMTCVRVRTSYKWWQCVVNAATFSVYKLRTVEVSGRISEEVPK